MLKDITLGQYFPGNSFVHRLDPRTKLLLMSAYIVAVFIVGNMWLFTLVAAYVIGVTAIAGVPVSYLWRSLKPLRFILIFMFAINLLVTATGDTLFEWWIIKITTGGLRQAVYISLRLILLVSGTSLMTLTTTPIALTDGLERLLSPFAKMGFPAHELAMMMTIALRFIPTLIEEADKITKAQTARGADFEAGSLNRPCQGNGDDTCAAVRIRLQEGGRTGHGHGEPLLPRRGGTHPHDGAEIY